MYHPITDKYKHPHIIEIKKVNKVTTHISQKLKPWILKLVNQATLMNFFAERFTNALFPAKAIDKGSNHYLPITYCYKCIWHHYLMIEILHYYEIWLQWSRSVECRREMFLMIDQHNAIIVMIKPFETDPGNFFLFFVPEFIY